MVGDQCMYGLMTKGPRGQWMPAQKKTKFMTNSHGIASELSRRCDGKHKHQQLIGGRAAAAARYPPQLCEAICRGLLIEKEWAAHGVKCLMRVTEATRIDAKEAEHEEDINIQAWDDLTGLDLDPGGVRQARLKEIGYAREKEVWTKITRKEAKRRGIKVLKTRWIDVNKGDAANILIRSRFVAKEFNTGEEAGLFAATPPLEALRLLISEAATMEQGRRREDQVIMVNDVARAFFEAPITREVCIELPTEDMTDEDREQDAVGLLKMSLYGTRDAAANFQREVGSFMQGIGFIRGKYNPCTYWHPRRGLKTLVHGDDFVTQGDRTQAAWLKKELEKRFEIKTKVVGTGKDDVKEERILNRVIRAGAQGWEYEPDQRHAELIIAGLNLQEAKGVTSPWEDPKAWQKEEDAQPLGDQEARDFRALAARANYLALDRPDIQYSTKEICRGMSRPTKGDHRRLKRLGRYLVESPRAVMVYRWQGRQQGIDGFTDSDWAGCPKSLKSTSGGALMIGGHCVKSWSSTQKCVTLSSGEAELVATVKTSTETIGLAQLARDWGVELEGKILTDSSAALGVVRRKGNGKLRHINVGMMWIQQKEEDGELEFEKVRGDLNPSDLMTKGLQMKTMKAHMARLGQEWREGRASAGLQLSKLVIAKPKVVRCKGR